MNILIVGAGIGGLCAGLALRRLGHEVTIFEQVRDVRPVGAAISIWSNGVKCLNHLGLAERVRALGGQMDGMSYRDGFTGAVMTGFSLKPLYESVGERAYPVARGELQYMLMDEFGPEQLHLGMRLQTLEEDGLKVTARFEDGTSWEGDLLIGADGAHSLVRTYVLGESPQRRYAGYVNWNGLVTADSTLAPVDEWTTFVGDGKRVSMMPVAGGRFYFFFDVPLPKGLENDRSQYQTLLREHFAGWADPVQRLIDVLPVERTNRVEIHDIDPFMTWVKGRVLLLGDSAHNTTPDIGQGGCMAMEDAVVLEQCLAAPNISLDEALALYQKKRVERAAELVLRARKRSQVTHALDKAATDAWYDELRVETGERIIAGIAANIHGGPLA